MRRLIPIAVIAACAACRPASRQPEGEAPASPQVTLYGVRLRYFRGPDLVASGRTAKLTYRRFTSDFVASEVLMRFPGRAGRGLAGPPADLRSDLEVRAQEASGNLPSRQVEGTGGVVLRTGSGLVGRTARARFDGRARVVTGDDPVQVDGLGYALAANGFRADLDDERFTLHHGVKSELGGRP